MAKKIKYAELYTLRKDGRYVGTYTDEGGKRHHVYDRNTEKLYRKIEEAQKPKVLTFKEVAKVWQVEHAERVSYNAADMYKAPIKQLCELWGKTPIGDISPCYDTIIFKSHGETRLCKADSTNQA